MVAHGVAGIAALVAALVATGGLVWLAWPDRLLGLLAALTGRREAWDAGRLTDADEARMLALARRLQGAVLALVFAWAFVAGAALAWARLQPG